MNILSILPEGKGTYITVGVGIVFIWVAYALAAFGIWTGAPDTLTAACALDLASADETVKAACDQLKSGPLTLQMAISLTILFLTQAFQRRAVK